MTRDDAAAAAPSCHGCRSPLAADAALLVSFGGRLWHPECLTCASCTITIEDVASPLLLLSDGRPVCRECPYMCCKCHRSLPDEKIYKDVVSVFGRADSPFGPELFTAILVARDLQRIWCAACRVPDALALPLELLRRVLEFNLPEATNRPFDRRSSALRDLSAVSRTWRAVAQPTLFIEPVLAWWGQERRFLSTIEERPELGRCVRTVWVGDASAGRAVPAPPWQLGRLFELCPMVGTVHLLHLSSVVPNDLLMARAVTTLDCRSLSFSSTLSLSPSPLLYLHQLILINCDLALLPAAFLTPSTLPALRTLVLRHTRTPYTLPHLAPLLSSLSSLSTDTNHRLALAPHLSSAASLRALSLPGELASDLVLRLPTPLRFLHLPLWADRIAPPASLVQLVKDATEAGVLDERSTLVVPREWVALKDLEGTCAKRGIALVGEEAVLGWGKSELESGTARAVLDPEAHAVFWALVRQIARGDALFE